MATQQNKAPRRGKIPGAVVSKTGAKYEVTRTSHINGRVVNAGEVVDYDGVPGRYLKPLNAEAKAAKAEADEIRNDRTESVVKTETLNSGRAANRKLRELDNQRRGVDEDADDPLKEAEPTISDAQRKEYEKQAEQTAQATLEQSLAAGGTTLQMTGKSPETVVPTTGPGAVATAEQVKSADAQKGDAKKK
jgi:hypothetical protein